MNEIVFKVEDIVNQLENQKEGLAAEIKTLEQQREQDLQMIQAKDKLIEGLSREIKNLSYSLEKNNNESRIEAKEEAKRSQEKYETELKILVESKQNLENENANLQNQLKLLSLNLKSFKDSRKDYEFYLKKRQNVS